MVTLFHHLKTRSSRFIFLLEELDAPCQNRSVSPNKEIGPQIGNRNRGNNVALSLARCHVMTLSLSGSASVPARPLWQDYG